MYLMDYILQIVEDRIQTIILKIFHQKGFILHHIMVIDKEINSPFFDILVSELLLYYIW